MSGPTPPSTSLCIKPTETTLNTPPSFSPPLSRHCRSVALHILDRHFATAKFIIPMALFTSDGPHSPRLPTFIPVNLPFKKRSPAE